MRACDNDDDHPGYPTPPSSPSHTGTKTRREAQDPHLDNDSLVIPNPVAHYSGSRVGEEQKKVPTLPAKHALSDNDHAAGLTNAL